MNLESLKDLPAWVHPCLITHPMRLSRPAQGAWRTSSRSGDRRHSQANLVVRRIARDGKNSISEGWQEHPVCFQLVPEPSELTSSSENRWSDHLNSFIILFNVVSTISPRPSAATAGTFPACGPHSDSPSGYPSNQLVNSRPPSTAASVSAP
jgi:hypothetical protein